MQGLGRTEDIEPTKIEKKALISACLIGVRCRFDGSQRLKKDILKKLKGSLVIPICPEQSGGLSTPRMPAEIAGGAGFDVLQGQAKVIDSTGHDVTQHYLKGAKEAMKIARFNKVNPAHPRAKARGFVEGLQNVPFIP